MSTLASKKAVTTETQRSKESKPSPVLCVGMERGIPGAITLPLVKTFGESARLAAAKARKAKAMANLDSAVKGKGHESSAAVTAGHKADAAEKNYDKVSREETKKKVVKDVKSGAKETSPGHGEKLKSLKAQESVAYRELAQAKKSGKDSEIKSAKAKADSLSKKRKAIEKEALDSLNDSADSYRRKAKGE